MDKNALFKKVREYFKKKRKFWTINYQELNDMTEAYSNSENILNELSKEFTEEEKEKYDFNRLRVGVTPFDDNYIIQVYYR